MPKEKFIAKNAGAKICIYDKYITVKKNFLSKDVMIPLKEIASVESGFLGLEINTKDKKSYSVALKIPDKKKARELLIEKLVE